jgi:putative SOS response-associated peptidase YedK
MPVILQQPDIAKWLDPEADLAELRSLLVPFSGPMRSWAVSKKVNGTRVDGPELTRPWSDPQLTLF